LPETAAGGSSKGPTGKDDNLPAIPIPPGELNPAAVERSLAESNKPRRAENLIMEALEKQKLKISDLQKKLM